MSARPPMNTRPPEVRLRAGSSSRLLLGRFVQRLDLGVALTLLVVLGMLAYVSYVAIGRGSGAELWTILRRTWWLVLLLTVPYLGARMVVWYELLCQLDISVPTRQLMVAFAGGELTKSLPAGIYVQNYLLGRLGHLGQRSLVRSTMATTTMLGLESVLALPTALIIGLPGTPWLSWVLLGLVGAWVAFLLLFALLVRFRQRHIGPRAAAWRYRLVSIIGDFLAAGREFLTFRTARSLVPTAVYMLAYAAELYLIIRAAGGSHITLHDAMGIYAVLVLATILVPIPSEIGITEFTGLSALLAYGLPPHIAAIIMLGFRILGSGSVILLAGAAIFLLRRELAQERDVEQMSGHLGVYR